MAKAAKTAQRTEGGAERRPKLDGFDFSAKGVRLSILPPAERISLRAPVASLDALAEALKVDLPRKPKTSATAGARTALWLGPDEWLVFDRQGKSLLADLAGVAELHSAVDISHRNVAFAVSGPAAEATLAAGCPQDLSLDAFPVDACSRTILGKVEVLVLRTGEDAFRVECWRSFSDHVSAFLEEAARDAAH